MEYGTYSIKTRLILFMIVVAMLPNMLITFFLQRKMTEVVDKELCVSQQSNISHMLKRFDLMLKDVDIIAANIVNDRNLYEQINRISDSGSAFDNYKFSNSIKEQISRFRDTKAEIDSIYIVDIKNNRGFSTMQYGYASGEWMDFFGWNQLQIHTRQEDAWGLFEENVHLRPGTPDSKEDRMILFRKRTCYFEDEPLFSLYINIKSSTVRDMLEKMNVVPGSEIYMLTGDGEKIASISNGGHLLEEALANIQDQSTYSRFKSGTEEYLCTYVKSDIIDGGIVAIIPTSQIDSALRSSKMISASITIITVMIILIFGYYVYRLLYSPIDRLIAVMQKNESGEITLSDLAERKDEFGRLGKQFNTMLLKVSTLNKRLYQQEISARNAEIKLLQSQINPHFLYNVLDTIHWMAKMGETEKVSNMAISLSRYYRRSLSGGREFVTLTEAVDLMCAYWDVVKIRFLDKVELSVEVEESVRNCIVPKQMLQPILENAINHATEKVERKILVIVSAFDCDDMLKVIVEDNGCGIEPLQLKQLQKDLQSLEPVRGSNFALRNLNSQIRLTYGDQYGLTIESEAGEGTIITIRVPKTLYYPKEEVQNV